MRQFSAGGPVSPVKQSKLSRVACAITALGLIVPLAVQPALGASRYWSGSGTWDNGISTNWGNAPGVYTGTAWSDGSDANFEGTAGTVSVSGTITSVGSITFDSAGYVLTKGTLNLAGPITANQDATIGSVLGGGDLTKAGAGTLKLAGGAAYSYSGATAVTDGTLVLSWAPTQLPDVTGGAISLQRWYDATDLTNGGGNPANGAAVTTWSDKSGKGLNATASVVRPAYATNAINGNPAVTLGSSKYLAFSQTGLASGTAASTMFAVGQLTTLPNTWNWMVATGWNNAGGASRGLGVNPANQLEFNAMYSGTEGPTLAINTPVVTDAVFGGTPNSVVGYWNYNGTAGSSAYNPALVTNTSSGNAYIGHQAGTYAEYWLGQVGEILIYSGALSDTQRQQVEAYLNYKWLGVTSPATNLLPTGTSLQLASGATLDMAGSYQQVASLADYAPGSQGTVQNSSTARASTLTVTTTGTVTFSGVIAGGGGLGRVNFTMSGSGTQVLCGDNTHTGATTVNSGTLQLGNGTTSNGSVGRNIVNNASVVFANPNSQTFANPISGTGSLTKTAGGTLVLSAQNTYGGATVITGGTLQLGTAPVQLPDVTSGAVSLERWYDATDLTNGGGNPDDGSLVTTWYDKSGNAKNATAVNSPTYSASAIGGKSAVTLGNLNYMTFDMTGLASGSAPSTMFVVGQLTGAPGNWNWMVAYGNAGTRLARGIGVTAGRLLDYTVYGGDVQGPALADNVPVMADAVFDGSATNSVVGNYTYNGASGSVTMNPTPLTTATTGGWIGKQAGGTMEYWMGQVGEILIYNGALTDSERKQVEAYLNYKWLGIQLSNVLPTGTPVQMDTGATLDLAGVNQQIGSLADYVTGSKGTVTNTSATPVTLTLGAASGSTTFSGVITGPISLVKSGGGTQILQGANTYTGVTTVNGGTLAYGADSVLPSDDVTVNGPTAVLALGAYSGTVGSVTVDGGGQITGSGTLTSTSSFEIKSGVTSAVLAGSGIPLNKTTGGTATLHAANTYSGTTTVSEGVLRLDSAGGPAIADNLVVAGGTAQLAQSNQVPGGKTVSVTSGVFDIQGKSNTLAGVSLTGGALAGTTGTLTSTTAFDVQAGNIGAKLAGSVGLSKSTSGTVNLSAPASYSGPTIISGGRLRLEGIPVAGAALWFDAMDTNTMFADTAKTTVVSSDGEAVAVWADKSGNGHDAVQAFFGSEPTYAAGAIGGKSSLTLGTGRYMDFSPAGLASGSSPCTIFAIADQTTVPGNWDWIVAYGTSGNAQARGLGVSPANFWTFLSFGGGDAIAETGPGVQPFVMSGVWNSTDPTIVGYVNGTAVAASSTPSNTVNIYGKIGQQVGNLAEWWTGRVGEVLIYNTALADADRQAVEAYLAAKWLGGGLPAAQLLPPATAVQLTDIGATLDLNGFSQTIGSLSGVAGSLLTLGTGTLTVGDATNTTFPGDISGGGGLTKQGAGVLTLSGVNVYEGGTTVNAGTLEIASATALPIGRSLTIGASGTVVLSSGLSATAVAGAGHGPAAPVPEPGTFALLAAGLAAVLFAAWRRR